MRTNLADPAALQALEARLTKILPAEYEDFEEVQPVSMGSALLKYGPDGKVAWGEIWGSFCDLAMAGGPPHKGMLLRPGSRAEIEAQPDRYNKVVEEICRGLRLVSDFTGQASPMLGWVRVNCDFGSLPKWESAVTAEWLVRAIVMENVSAHCEGSTIDLPAGPGYRTEKEIKNVVTAIAKTCHYWFDHMEQAERREVADLFAAMAAESPLIQPSLSDDDDVELGGEMAAAIQQATGLSAGKHPSAGWLGVECKNVHAAIWMMRALVATNVLSRREGTVLFLPVNRAMDAHGEIVVRSFMQVQRFAKTRGLI